MQVLVDIIRQTLRTLWAHKLRSFLTMFGIAWGVGSLLLLVGVGEGFRSGNERHLAEIGQDIMFIFPGRAPAVEGSTVGMRPYFLTYEDYLSVKNEARMVRNVAPVINRGDVRVVSQFASAGGQITGVTPNFNQIRYLPQAEGRWLNERDEQERRFVAVLGDELKRNLFPGQAPLGATILLNGVRFDVIGTVQRVGRGDNNSANARVYIPFSAMTQLFPVKGENVPPNAISFMNYQPRTRDEHKEAKLEVRKLIARNHGFDYRVEEAFEGWDTIEGSKTIGKIFDAMNVFLGSVGLVTLALGAIGIVNIMLVSVGERTKEIGLRKALGATNRSIMVQFFLEGAFLAVFSGGIGIAVAAGLMALLGNVRLEGPFDPPKLVASSATIAVAALTLAAIFAGLYPARKAAQLQPVEALRFEHS